MAEKAKCRGETYGDNGDREFKGGWYHADGAGYYHITAKYHTISDFGPREGQVKIGPKSGTQNPRPNLHHFWQIEDFFLPGEINRANLWGLARCEIDSLGSR